MSSTSFFNTITSTSSSALDSVDRNVSKGLKFLGNQYIHHTLLAVLILYAAHFAPKINVPVAKVLDNFAVKFICVFLLTYLLGNSVKVALISAIVIVVGAMVIKKFNNQENLAVSVLAEMKKEHFSLDEMKDSVINKSSEVLSYGKDKVYGLSETAMSYRGSALSNIESTSEDVLLYGEHKLSDIKTFGSGMLNKAESLLESEPRALGPKATKSLDLNNTAAADHSNTLGKDLNTDEIKKIQKVIEEQVSLQSQQSQSQPQAKEPVGVCMGNSELQGDNLYGWNVNLDDAKYDVVKGYTDLSSEHNYAPL